MIDMIGFTVAISAVWWFVMWREREGSYKKLKALMAAAEHLSGINERLITIMERQADLLGTQSGTLATMERQIAVINSRIPVYTSGVAGEAVLGRRSFISEPLEPLDPATMFVTQEEEDFMRRTELPEGVVTGRIAVGSTPISLGYDSTRSLSVDENPVAPTKPPEGTGRRRNIKI